jgi:hypothetical protein
MTKRNDGFTMIEGGRQDARVLEAEANARAESERKERARIEADIERFRLEHQTEISAKRLAEAQVFDEIDVIEQARKLRHAETEAEIARLSREQAAAAYDAEECRRQDRQKAENEESEARFEREEKIFRLVTEAVRMVGGGIGFAIRERMLYRIRQDEIEHETIRAVAEKSPEAVERALATKRLAESNPFRD